VEPRGRLKEKGCGLVFILSAPSGSGKSTLIRNVMDRLGGLQFSVSYTTRLPRSNEEEGIDYHFVSPAQFQKMVNRREFLEWAEILGNHYGTTRPDFDRLKADAMDLLLDIDIQGSRRVVEQVAGAISIFILPPSPEILRTRLVERRLDSPESIERRLASAKREIEEAPRYHYLILNEGLEEAVQTLMAVIVAERCRKEKDSIFVEKIKEWEGYYGQNYR